MFLKVQPMSSRPSSLPRGAALAALLGLAACATTASPTIDSAFMPTDANGAQVMSDQGAISLASYNFGEASRTHGNPAQGALSIAAIDYLAGHVEADPRYIGLPAITKEMLKQGRVQERQVLGVAPGTPSQVVVNSMVAVSQAQNPQAALAALPASVFTRGPEATLALLGNLPYMQLANAGSQAIDHNVSFSCNLLGLCGV